MFIHYLTYLFRFCILLAEKYRSIKATKDDFYHKVIETKCIESIQLKAGYTAKEKRVWRFCVNKNYFIKDIINKFNSEKEKRVAYTKYFFFMFFKHA